MFRLSQSAGYAVRALSCLDEDGRADASLGEISARSGVPAAYLRKLAKRLVATGLLTTRRGRRGGVRLSRSAGRISLLEVVRAFEPADVLQGCLLGPGACRGLRACPLHAFWQREQRRILNMLAGRTLAELIAYETARRDRRNPRRRRMRLCE